ncbi:unnamed protein product [Sympodiomycopsis kandeliae]
MEDEDAEEKRIQEQRRKRQELLQQYAAESSASTSESNTVADDKQPITQPDDANVTQKQIPEDTTFSLEKTEQDATTSTPGKGEVSAAEYDPSMDRKKGDAVEAEKASDSHSANKSSTVDDRKKDDDDSEYEEIEVEDDDDDDDDDMFAIPDEDEPAKKKKTKIIRVKKTLNTNNEQTLSKRPGETLPSHNGLTDNWDDSEGYYRIVLGERIGDKGRFHVFANLGKGMFSEVVRAKDLGLDGKGNGEKEVAIKIVRSQETMYKAAHKEIGILNKLASLDPDDKRHIIRLISHFEHRGHLCMVFESLNMNLRDVVKRFGKDVGLNLGAVRAYTHQILLGLSLMKRAEVMHADLKPDNILVNENKTVLKICDLGSASTLDEMQITPYLVSRFYRAPEIIIGNKYDCSLDMWSIGCTLYELYTGKILFPGRNNNDMLLLIQELKGKLTTKLIKKGQFSSQHFDSNNHFISSNGTIKVHINAKNDLKNRLLPPNILKSLSKTSDQKELKMILNFVDLLNRMLELDPSKRILPNDALKHPFLN